MQGKDIEITCIMLPLAKMMATCRYSNALKGIIAMALFHTTFTVLFGEATS